MLNATGKSASPLQLHDYDRIHCQSTLRVKFQDDEDDESGQFLSLSQTTSQDFVCEYKEEMCEPHCVCCQVSFSIEFIGVFLSFLWKS